MKTGITVVICTYNGAALLPETLRHIAQQQVRQEIKWEVIVVDNASTDKTSQVVITEWEKHTCDVKLSLLHQPKQGLTFARELALQSARFDFVLFCDDDNWLNPNYVNLSYDIMMKRPSIGVLGGYGELWFETPPPYWAHKYKLFANGPQANASGKVHNNRVYGAGFVVRKSAYERLIKAGFSPMLTDRKGGYLSSGGDYEICYAIAMAGYDIWYEEKLKFKHFMPKERINSAYYTRFIKEGPKCFEVLIPYRVRINSGISSMLFFYLKLIKIFLTYSFKVFPLLIDKHKYHADPEFNKLNSMMLMSLKYKLLSFKGFATMKDNFLKIKNFENNKLHAYKVNRRTIDLKSKPISHSPYKVY